MKDIEELIFFKEYKDKIGHCEYCGETGRLDVHHIYTRKIKKLKKDPKNLIVLCRSCHNYFHQHPKKSREWLWENRPDTMEYLRIKKQKIK